MRRIYRRRILAQAVSELALGYAREVFAGYSVRTKYNSLNVPILTINRKLGSTIKVCT